MTEVFIAGVSMTPFGSQPGESVNSLSAQSIRLCLEDAGAGASQLGAIYYSNSAQRFIESTHGLPAKIALPDISLKGLPLITVANSCASASTAFWLARNHVLTGQDDLVLAVGTEKMTFNNETKTDILRPTLSLLKHSLLCRKHMLQFGTTQRQLAVIASKNHANSMLNPKCHNYRSFTVEEVLNEQVQCYPLTVPMCSFVSDGSAAALIATANGLKKLKGENRAIRIDSCILASGTPQKWDDFENHLVSRTASKAYARAGIGPEDVDIAEVHDATSFDELFITELLGFCKSGGGGRFAESGATNLKGRFPINPSGGLMSKGHPIGATGLGQLYELVMQLRAKAGARQVDYARVAVQENGCGLLGSEEEVAVVTVLSR